MAVPPPRRGLPAGVALHGYHAQGSGGLLHRVYGVPRRDPVQLDRARGRCGGVCALRGGLPRVTRQLQGSQDKPPAPRPRHARVTPAPVFCDPSECTRCNSGQRSSPGDVYPGGSNFQEVTPGMWRGWGKLRWELLRPSETGASTDAALTPHAVITHDASEEQWHWLLLARELSLHVLPLWAACSGSAQYPSKHTGFTPLMHSWPVSCTRPIRPWIHRLGARWAPPPRAAARLAAAPSPVGEQARASRGAGGRDATNVGRINDRMAVGDTIYADDTALCAASWSTMKRSWHSYVDMTGRFEHVVAYDKTKAMVAGKDDSGGALLAAEATSRTRTACGPASSVSSTSTSWARGCRQTGATNAKWRHAAAPPARPGHGSSPPGLE
eukprot:gene129-biopygen22544